MLDHRVVAAVAVVDGATFGEVVRVKSDDVDCKLD